jgi:hypothetical protein
LLQKVGTSGVEESTVLVRRARCSPGASPAVLQRVNAGRLASEGAEYGKIARPRALTIVSSRMGFKCVSEG